MISSPNQILKPFFIGQNHRVRNFAYKHGYRSKTRQYRKGHGSLGIKHFQEQVAPEGWLMVHSMVIKVGHRPVMKNRNSNFIVNRNNLATDSKWLPNKMELGWLFTGNEEAKAGGPAGLLPSIPNL